MADPMEAQATWEGHSQWARLFLWYLRNIGDHPGKLRIARFLAVHGFRNAVPVVSQHGAHLEITPEDWIGRQIAFHGAYEPVTLALCARLLRRGGLFVDVGACFGLYTCSLGVLPGVACISAEPSPESFLELQRNVSLNPAVHASLCLVALDSQGGVVRLTSPDATNVGRNRVAADVSASTGILVGSATLDSLLERASEGHAPTLVKIDVEGLELRVLQGLDLRSRRRPEHIVLELNSCVGRLGGSSTELLEFMASNGYEARSVNGSSLDLDSDVLEANVWFRATDE
jgi:FkbM family methyltransferase